MKTQGESDNSHKILFIEDDANLASMYKIKLEREGFVVSIFPDGKGALKAIRDTHPDLVLLDILMPKKDGFDVLGELGGCPDPETKNTPVIVLTNLASPQDEAEGRRLGARDWWVKAFNTPAEVAAKVKKFLAGDHAKALRSKVSVEEKA